jgi:K+-transporting ATPase KdpF subunit
VSALHGLIGVIAAGLFVYLVYALLDAEEF